jgi:hypothetical protein
MILFRISLLVFNHPINDGGEKKMSDKNPIEYTGKVLNQRNNLTGPDDREKSSYPVRPQHIPVKESNQQNNQ